MPEPSGLPKHVEPEAGGAVFPRESGGNPDEQLSFFASRLFDYDVNFTPQPLLVNVFDF